MMANVDLNATWNTGCIPTLTSLTQTWFKPSKIEKTIRKDAVREVPLISPPLELQNQFAERVQAIEAQKAQAQACLAQAEDLFNSLLQRAFKGELTT